MESVEAAGATVDDAVAAALLQIGATRDEVDVEVLDDPNRDAAGTTAEGEARVRVTRRGGTTGANQETPAVDPAVTAALAERGAQLLRDIVGRVGIDVTVEIRMNDEGILLDLLGDASGILIGRHGQMLDALEYIVNRILLRDDEHAARVVIDSNDYRARRRAALEDLALRMAEQAKRKRRPVMLNPMPPQDRRIIHLALQDDPSLTTRSAGTGVLRRLVIIPEGVTFNAHDFE